jgi:hypothetical protein
VKKLIILPENGLEAINEDSFTGSGSILRLVYKDITLP